MGRTDSSTTSRSGTPGRRSPDLSALKEQPGSVDLAARAAENAHHRRAVVSQPDLRPAGPRADPVAFVAIRHHQPVAGHLHEDELEGVQPVGTPGDHAAHDVSWTADEVIRGRASGVAAVDVARWTLEHGPHPAQATGRGQPVLDAPQELPRTRRVLEGGSSLPPHTGGLDDGSVRNESAEKGPRELARGNHSR